MTFVSITSSEHIATLRLNDPKRRNALGTEMLAELIAAFDALSSEIRVVVLRTGPDDPVWCAGFDIKSLKPGFDPLAHDGLLQSLFGRISNCAAPVIGMIHGSTWGGGTDLALRCDMLIGDPTAQFAFTPARLGLPYDSDGLLNVVSRVGPALALEMFATAKPIQAERALRSGILNHLIDIDQLEAFTAAFAAGIAENAPLTIASAKQYVRAFSNAVSIPLATRQALAEGRDRALHSSDYAEGIEAFAAKRTPIFRGR